LACILNFNPALFTASEYTKKAPATTRTPEAIMSVKQQRTRVGVRRVETSACDLHRQNDMPPRVNSKNAPEQAMTRHRRDRQVRGDKGQWPMLSKCEFKKNDHQRKKFTLEFPMKASQISNRLNEKSRSKSGTRAKRVGNREESCTKRRRILVSALGGKAAGFPRKNPGM